MRPEVLVSVLHSFNGRPKVATTAISEIPAFGYVHNIGTHIHCRVHNFFSVIVFTVLASG